jgi:hypothetical protein
MSSRDASDVIYRNDYITRYISFLAKQQNTIGAIYTINDGSGAANEASEVTYLTIGSTLVPNVVSSNEFFRVAPLRPTSRVTTIYTGSPSASLATSNGTYIIDGSTRLYQLSGTTVVNTITYPAPITSIGKDLAGNIYVTTSNAVYENTQTGIVPMNITGLSNISALTVNSNVFFFLQAGSSRIFSATQNTAVTVVAGSNAGFAEGIGSSALFSSPASIALDPSSTILFVADTGNSLLRTMRTVPPYSVITVAGNSTGFFTPTPTDNVGNRDGIGLNGENLLYSPQGITVAPNGVVYIADTNNNNIRSLTNGYLATLAGQPGSDPIYEFSPPGYVDGFTSNALFTSPTAISYYDSALYITEPSNGTVRVLTLV